MLYQTFPCNPFSTKLSSSLSQVEKGMGCIVKGGFTPRMILEDVCCNFSPQNNNNVSVAGDDYFVDQLLNLNNDEDQQQQQQHVETTEEEHEQQQPQQQSCCYPTFVAVKQEPLDNVTEKSLLSSPLDTVLSVPAEEADLEWLSNFVEESFSQFSNPYPPGYVKPKPEPRPEPELRPVGHKPAPVSPPSLSRSRSKRARTGGRVWPRALSEATSSSSSLSSSSSTAPSSPCSSGPNSGMCFGKDVAKKQKKGEVVPGGVQRRCSHCGVQSTPQWRQGPHGAKTLCNACGVRYKSGRLYPEYRPAGSPTFSSKLHSNSHRKVLEMRKKKEVMGFHRPLSSFG